MVADQAGKLLGKCDCLVQLGGMLAQVSQQRPLVRAALLCPAQHKLGRGAWRQHAPGRCDQHRPRLFGRLASQHNSLRRAQALEVAGERGVAAPGAVVLQRAKQLTAVTASTVPVLEHDVLPSRSDPPEGCQRS